MRRRSGKSWLERLMERDSVLRDAKQGRRRGYHVLGRVVWWRCKVWRLG